MAIDWGAVGNSLTGAGMGLQGRGGDFQRILESQKRTQLAQQESDEATKERQYRRDRERQLTMFTDSAAAMKLASQGRFDLAAQMFDRRVQAGKNFEGIDFSDSEQMRDLLAGAARGDPLAAEQAMQELGSVVQLGQATGIYGGPAKYTDIQRDTQGRPVGLNPNTNQYEPIGMAEGIELAPESGRDGGMASAKTTHYDNGTVLATLPTGETRLWGPDGQEISDPQQRREVLSQARSEQVDFARAKAEAGATGKGEGEGRVGRANEVVTMGLDAARSLPVLNRSLQLLEQVETGGLDRAILAGKQLFGIESADEAELTNQLGKAILSQLRSTFGAAFTAAEGKQLERIESNLGKSTAGNKRIIRQLVKMSNQKVDRAIKAAKYLDDGFAVEELNSYRDMSLGDDEVRNLFGVQQAPAPATAVGGPPAAPQPAGGGVRFLGFEG